MRQPLAASTHSRVLQQNHGSYAESGGLVIARLVSRFVYGRWTFNDKPLSPCWHYRRRRLIRWLKGGV